MSGGSDTATSTTGAPSWLQPYQRGFLDQAGQIANTPYQASPTQISGPNQFQQQGYQALANRATQGSPVMSAANQQLTNTINGGYLNSNPYLDQNIQAAQQDLTRGYNETVRPAQDALRSRSGSFGNSGVEQSIGTQNNDFANSLGRIGSQMRGQNYAMERGYQNSAINAAPSFAQSDYNDANQLISAGNQAQMQTDRQNQQNYQWWREANQYPREQLQVAGDALGTVLGNNRSTTQTTPGTSTAASVAGGALTLAQLYQLMNSGGG